MYRPSAGPLGGLAGMAILRTGNANEARRNGVSSLSRRSVGGSHTTARRPSGPAMLGRLAQSILNSCVFAA